jgi:hypothetical protein
VIDWDFVTRDATGDVTFVEFDQLDENHDAARLASVSDQIESPISDEDILELAVGPTPGRLRNHPRLRAPPGRAVP